MRTAAPSQPPSGEPRTRHFRRGHITALDGLRGLAILGVMATHLLTGDMSHAGFIIHTAFVFATAGVDLFFVLSGFLITGILQDSVGGPRYFRTFYARRALRIFPLYYGVLLALLLLTRPLGLHWSGTFPAFLLYLQNLRWLPSLFSLPPQKWVRLDHLWSLAVEEQFYLVWPLVLVFVRRSRSVLLLCVAGVILAFVARWYGLTHGLGFDWANRTTVCRMDELLAGGALLLLTRHPTGERLCTGAATAFAVLLPTVIGYFWLLYYHPPAGLLPFTISFSYTCMALLSMLLIASCLHTGSVPNRIFHNRTLRFFGKYSYGLYVLHVLPLPALEHLLQHLRRAGVPPVPARLGIAAAAFALSTAAAWLSFQLYEKQFLRLKRFFDYAPPPTAL